MQLSEKPEDLVSIIIPSYNCADFIGFTIDSILNQTYLDWEAIIVDDCSTDNTVEVVQSYIHKDNRIHCYKLNKNSGPAVARNTALDYAKGRFIAFLDSDDIWFPRKLEKQIKFMRDNNCFFTCTSYNKIDEGGKDLNRVIRAKSISDYEGILRTCPGNSTVIYDSHKLGKIKIPDIKKRNDYVMWLKVIKKAQLLYGLDEPLGSHRIRNGSVSSNKFKLVKYQWQVYYKIEKLSAIKSLYLILYWTIYTVFKLR